MIPPFIGFFGKQSVIYSAIDSGLYFMTFVAIIVSVISAAYYLILIKEAYSHSIEFPISNEIGPISKENSDESPSFIALQENSLEIDRTEPQSVEFRLINLSNIHAFIISLLTFTIIFFFFNPSILMNSASLITLNYFYL